MKKVKFRYVISLFFLMIVIAMICFLIWTVIMDKHVEMSSLLILIVICLCSILSFLFYKFNKRWARFVFLLVVIIVLSLFIYQQNRSKIIRQENDRINSYGSGPFLPNEPNENLPKECHITAIIGKPKDVSSSRICYESYPGSHPGGCTTVINYLIPVNILSSVDISLGASSSCSVLINTTQYTDRIFNNLKFGQKIKAKLIYGKYDSFEGYSYFYRLKDVSIIQN